MVNYGDIEWYVEILDMEFYGISVRYGKKVEYHAEEWLKLVWTSYLEYQKVGINIGKSPINMGI